MSPRVKPWTGLAVAAVGLGLCFFDGRVGIAVSFVGVFLSVPFALNIPINRLAHYLAIGVNAAAIYIASSHSLGTSAAFLGASGALVLVGLGPNEVLVRRSGRAMFLQSLAGFVAGLICFALAWPLGWWSLAVAPNFALSALVTTSWVTDHLKLAKFDPRQTKLRVGKPAPELELPVRGSSETFSLGAETGRFVLLCFLRGDWCGFCQVIMRLYQKEAPMLARHNVKVVVINPSEGDSAVAFAKDMGLDYTLLVDKDAAMARAWGLISGSKHEGQDIPLPVSILVGPDKIVRYISRPEDVNTLTNETPLRRLLEAAAAPA